MKALAPRSFKVSLEGKVGIRKDKAVQAKPHEGPFQQSPNLFMQLSPWLPHLGPLSSPPSSL